jgi:DNA-directed RNA polymerase subunit RPC12/RpoP
MSKLTLSPLLKEEKNKRWNLTPDLSFPHEPIVCPYTKCGKIFNQPIELTIRTKDSSKTYFACPHCFSKVDILDKKIENPSKDSLKKDVFSCAHFVGYLKTRSKDSPIPDECLTCNKILKCI